jgi:hypothetical protein
MPDMILDSAIARREAALREAQEWHQFIVRYQQLAEALPSTPNVEAPRPRREFDPETEIAKTVAAVAEALEEAARPLPLADLYKEVTMRGIVFSGANPKDNLGARLYNSKQFKSLGKKTGWWFTNRPLPEMTKEANPSDSPNNNVARAPAILSETVSSIALLPCANGARPTVHAPWDSVVKGETPNSSELFGAPKTTGHLPAVN